MPILLVCIPISSSIILYEQIDLKYLAKLRGSCLCEISGNLKSIRRASILANIACGINYLI